MTEQNSNAGNEIKDVENRRVGETIPERTSDLNSGVVGEPGEAPASPPRKALRGILERRWRRKNDIGTLHGLCREHARLIAAMHNGRITLEKGEVLSRAYSRHREMVSALEQRTQLAALQEQLEAITGKSSTLRLINDPNAKDDSQ